MYFTIPTLVFMTALVKFIWVWELEIFYQHTYIKFLQFLEYISNSIQYRSSRIVFSISLCLNNISFSTIIWIVQIHMDIFEIMTTIDFGSIFITSIYKKNIDSSATFMSGCCQIVFSIFDIENIRYNKQKGPDRWVC